jgi:hypothetical protein
MRVLSVVACLFCLASPALAESAAPEPGATESGRYSMTPAPGGFLRLDTRNGAVSLCKVENGAARCAAAIEERTALQDEIDRLARQNEALKNGGSTASKLPTREDFGRAMDFAEQFMRRMMRIMREDDSQKDRT